MSSIQPDHDDCEMNDLQEINGSFIITRCYRVVLLQSSKKIFEQMACAVFILLDVAGATRERRRRLSFHVSQRYSEAFLLWQGEFGTNTIHSCSVSGIAFHSLSGASVAYFRHFVTGLHMANSITPNLSFSPRTLYWRSSVWYPAVSLRKRTGCTVFGSD